MHLIFPFLKYIDPTWYFNLPSKARTAYFPDYDQISNEERLLINLDQRYSSRDVSRMDAAYAALRKGFILADATKALRLEEIHPVISDNYLFVRKYYSPIWSWYVLLLRLMTLHNPFREIHAFIRQSEAKRVRLYDRVYPHEAAYRLFDSALVRSAPKVSVIIPTLNRYTYLKDALRDLERQDYRNFDVIIADQSDPFRPDFYKEFQLDIKLIRQEEKALWLARNAAVKSSDAEYLLLYDDDSRVEHDWISQHVKCLDYFRADISAGVSISKVGAKVPENYSFLRWADQLDTGNAFIKRDVFRRIGLFDRQFERQRMGDGEFGMRAYLAGFKSISNPYARRLHLKVGEGGLRQMGSWDAFRPKSWLAPRPIPSVLYLSRKYFGNKVAVYMLLAAVPPSLIPYQHKSNRILKFFGIFLAVVFLPVVLFQIFISWKQSSKKLQMGDAIDHCI
jgi:GT2 family glycosyltransferase